MEAFLVAVVLAMGLGGASASCDATADSECLGGPAPTAATAGRSTELHEIEGTSTSGLRSEDRGVNCGARGSDCPSPAPCFAYDGRDATLRYEVVFAKGSDREPGRATGRGLQWPVRARNRLPPPWGDRKDDCPE